MASSSILASFLQSLPSSRFSFKANSASFKNAGTHPLLCVLESKLAQQLDLLRSPEDEVGTSFLSAHWLNRALPVVLSTNSSVKAFVPDLPQSIADHLALCKWLDDSLEDNVRLLDACVCLHDSVLDIKSYHSSVEILLSLMAPPFLSEALLRRALHVMCRCNFLLKKKGAASFGHRRSKLENCGSLMRRMGERLNAEDIMKGNVLGVMNAAQMTTTLICGVISSALSFSQRRPPPSAFIPGQSNWALALSNLQQRVREQVEKKRSKNPKVPYLDEVEHLDATLQSFEELINGALSANQFPLPQNVEEPIRQTAVELRALSGELGQGMDLLEQHIGELYQVLITSRVMMLDIYPKSSTVPR